MHLGLLAFILVVSVAVGAGVAAMRKQRRIPPPPPSEETN